MNGFYGTHEIAKSYGFSLLSFNKVTYLKPILLQDTSHLSTVVSRSKKKLQEKWSKPGLYLMSKDELWRFSKFSNEGFKRYQLNYAGRSAHGWQIGWHWLAGNS